MQLPMILRYSKFILLFIVSFSFSFCSEEEEQTSPTIDPVVVIEEEEEIKEEIVVEEEEELEEEIEVLPNSILDFSYWNISIPIDRGDGIAKTFKVEELLNGYQSSDYFYPSDDGGVVFKCPIKAPKTSANTSYARTELREMLRGTNTDISTQGITKNNWVFGSAPNSDITASAGFDGLLEATLAVNYVTTTGNDSHKGRVIIGQIHANDNEPCRLYYRKLPNNTKGSIYFAHEPADGFGDEQYIEIIGSRSGSASNPTDGIALDEKFSYTIRVVGNDLTVTIIREGKPNESASINMANSGYSNGGKYQYFKAGVYNQNNTGDANDYVQATFYDLKQSHNN